MWMSYSCGSDGFAVDVPTVELNFARDRHTHGNTPEVIQHWSIVVTNLTTYGVGASWDERCSPQKQEARTAFILARPS